MKLKKAIFSILLLNCINVMTISAQEISQYVDSLNYQITVLLKTDLDEAYVLADSMLTVSKDRGWFPGEISARHQIGKYFRRSGSYDTAISIYLENIELVKSNLNNLEEGHTLWPYRVYGGSYYDLAMISYYRGEYEKSIDYSFLADSINSHFFLYDEDNQRTFKSSLTSSRVLRANIYSIRGEYEKSISVFKEAIALHLENERYYNASATSNSIGTLYETIGDLRNAMISFQSGLEIAKKHSFTTLEASHYSSIGKIYFILQDFSTSLTYVKKAFKIHQEAGDKFQIAYWSSDVGDAFKALENYDSAKWYYNYGLSLHKEMGNLDDQAYLLGKTSEMLMDIGEHSEALDYINRGLMIVNENELPQERFYLITLKARHQLETGDFIEGKKTINLALTFAEDAGSAKQKSEVYRIAHQIYSANEEKDSSYEYLKKYLVYKDSLYTKEKALDIAKVQYEFALDEERKLLIAESERQGLIYKQEISRGYWIAVSTGIGFILVLVITYILFRSNKHRKSANLLLKEKNKELIELRLKEKANAEETIGVQERELASMAMYSHEKNSLLQSLEQKINSLEKVDSETLVAELKKVKKDIISGYSTEESWDSFIHKFEMIHPNFFTLLKEKYPRLSLNDMKLSAYLKIGMTNKEIANASHLTHSTIKSQINRMKKKLSMKPEESLRDFVMKLA